MRDASERALPRFRVDFNEFFVFFFPHAPVNKLGADKYYLVNGQYQPALSLKPSEPRRLRMINAALATFLNIEIAASANENSFDFCFFVL